MKSKMAARIKKILNDNCYKIANNEKSDLIVCD